MINREEIQGLIADPLYFDSPPVASTKLTDWAKQHASELGAAYASELARRRNRVAK